MLFERGAHVGDELFFLVSLHNYMYTYEALLIIFSYLAIEYLWNRYCGPSSRHVLGFRDEIHNPGLLRAQGFVEEDKQVGNYNSE